MGISIGTVVIKLKINQLILYILNNRKPFLIYKDRGGLAQSQEHFKKN